MNGRIGFMVRTNFSTIGMCVLLLLLPIGRSLAQLDDEDEDFPPGLLATYSSAERAVQRVDPDVAFDWGNASPDSRLPRGPFQATWTGNLLVRQAGDYQIHVYACGEVIVKIDGEPVLDGVTDAPAWLSSDTHKLGFGDKALEVVYRSGPEKARIGLYWSSSAFDLEPIPAHLLFRDEPSAELARIERGRQQFDAHRCNRCHRRAHDALSPAARDLTRVASAYRFGQLVSKIENPSHSSDRSRMPRFGFSAEEAHAVAAYLWNTSEHPELPQLPAPKKKKKAKAPPSIEEEQRLGEILFRSTGCLGCHTVDKFGQSGPFSGDDLTNIGRIRTPEWIAAWLADPAKLNRDHQMPIFKLDQQERRQLALYLAARGRSTDAPKPDAGKVASFDKLLIERGKSLITANRCAACHRIAGVESNSTNSIADLSQAVDDWSDSCLAKQPDRSRSRPAYRGLDAEAVMSFVVSRAGDLSAESEFARGIHVLVRRNCTGCHERDLFKGIVVTAGLMAQHDEALARQSQGMIPPALSAVGDKLLDAALAQAVSGEQKTVRMPWLRIRMPRFKHTDQEKQALLDFLIAHDRIPEDAPHESTSSPASNRSSAQQLVEAHALVGPRGFSCIACHQIGGYRPRNVALGTRGSDLLMIGQRMREPYFMRWTRSPMRIVPGMEMPSYQKPLPGLLGGEISTQLAATWGALNDPRFKAPTNPSVVEQYLVVDQGEPARIVRDVFTNPEENGGGAVARALAIGLNNGHNLIFDLDLMAVRQWAFGDFARQRTIGKSWYWDLAGNPVVSGFAAVSDFALISHDDGPARILNPSIQHGSHGQLLSYRPLNDGIEFSYRLRFTPNGTPVTTIVTESIEPLVDDDNRSGGGWCRTIHVHDLPPGFDLMVARPSLTVTLGNPSIEIEAKPPSKSNLGDSDWFQYAQLQNREFSRLTNHGNGQLAAVLHYRCELQTQPLKLKPAAQEPARSIESVTSLPGYDGLRLPISSRIMPTALTWTADGKLAFTSLKGHVYLAHDSNGDGIEDRLTLFEDGLAAPFGIVSDGDDLIVAHKPEVLRLRDTDGDGRADERSVLASGWGYTDNYHDWTTGIVRDSSNNLYIGLGSDYAQRERPQAKSRWRGKVLRIDPRGVVTPIGHSFRYPIGLAIDSDDRIFVTDNQGVQNTFNEINHLITGRHYGVPSRHEQDPNAEQTPAALHLPHPWTRSVNGIFFLPKDAGPFAGHGVGCEYDSRFLVRFTIQEVSGTLQGASYYFSRPNSGTGPDNFLGPLIGAVGPDGSIYLGSIHDSGWMGGRNTGEIVRLRLNGNHPNGIRELRATHNGFVIEFVDAIDSQKAENLESYTISGYTRRWQGGYATSDSERHQVDIESVEVSPDGMSVRIKVNRLRAGFVYEVSCDPIGRDDDGELFPATGHYTMLQIPKQDR